MKHAGKAWLAGLKLVFLALVGVLAILAVAWLAQKVGAFVLTITWGLAAAWVLFTIFTFYFFRDPDARVPTGAGLVVAPAHGKVDAIGTTTETRFMGGECQRISIFLSVLDVHVQNAPVSGQVALCLHTPGQYLNAMRADSAEFNENFLIGIEASDPPRQKIGLRLIAGVLARRIIPWVKPGDQIERGVRISLIQFGSRADVYLPKEARIKVKLGDRVVGGETVLAAFE